MTEIDEEAVKFYGTPLTGKYKHFCMEFDGLPIDENCHEFKYCVCFEDGEEIQQLKQALHNVTSQ